MNDAEWQIPTYRESVISPQRYNHALVIPVLNEGERIRGQLLQIANAILPVDVIIADGGSYDGALDEIFLSNTGVRALLTKTGPGRLSAQLRVAYAWCLQQGYHGIVTIDGNGKDGIEAIGTMVSSLKDGFDYVQGSRYLPGGEARNTPLDRAIGNRLVHTPLLSLVGRYRFTDTTNGFRAYSAHYLLHHDVQPFREVFLNYELLFYLTVRAGQVGLRVGEVPVRREYPVDEPVPTKINGFAAKFSLLNQTLRVASGCFTPKPTGRKA